MPHPVTEKVWGSETLIANRDFCGKVMTLRKGMRCSLHYHRVKDETFLVTRGLVMVELGVPDHAVAEEVLWRRHGGDPAYHTKVVILRPGESIDVPPHTLHRFTGHEDSEFIEFSTHDDPADSIRLEPSGPAPV